MTHNSSFQPWPLPSVNPYFPALLVTIYTQKMYHHHPKLSVFTHRNLMVIIWFKLQFHLYNHAMQVPISSIKWKDSTASRRITHYLNWSISPKYSWEDHQFIDYTMSILLNSWAIITGSACCFSFWRSLAICHSSHLLQLLLLFFFFTSNSHSENIWHYAAVWSDSRLWPLCLHLVLS